LAQNEQFKEKFISFLDAVMARLEKFGNLEISTMHFDLKNQLNFTT